MFGKLAADALGLSDIGQVISPKDYDKVDSDDYIMHEDGEKIFFLIKSKTDEYCFTNFAFIHLDGTSAMSKKRLLYRYDYYRNNVSNVKLETAGTVDLDVEIKFNISGNAFSIDVNKRQLEQIKDLYKALVRMSMDMAEEKIVLGYADESVNVATNILARSSVGSNEKDIVAQFENLAEKAFTYRVEKRQTFLKKDYTDVFEKYIHN